MTTRLDRPIRREIVVDGEPYTVTISPHGIRLARKRFRSGPEWRWEVLLAAAELGGHREADRAEDD